MTEKKMDERFEIQHEIGFIYFLFNPMPLAYKNAFSIITLIIIALLIVYLIEPLVGLLSKIRIPDPGSRNGFYYFLPFPFASYLSNPALDI